MNLCVFLHFSPIDQFLVWRMSKDLIAPKVFIGCPRCTILCTLHHMLHLSCTLGSLTRPAFVFFRSSNAAPMYLLSNNRYCTGVLLGLALARRTLYPNPFLLSHGVSSAGQIYGVPDQVRWQASLPHLSRRATERRSEDTSR